MTTPKRIRVWERPGRKGKSSMATIIRSVCRVGDRETLKVRLDGAPQDELRIITLPWNRR
jgi:hypothetical protein